MTSTATQGAMMSPMPIAEPAVAASLHCVLVSVVEVQCVTL